ncbi:MAG: RNA 2',3'-cyclic phosphodiesterase [Myxococcales bacterium]
MRLFVALELDDLARKRLADYQHRLQSLDRAVRWVNPEQIHLTLKFLGEVPDRQIPELAQAVDSLATQPAFEFVMESVGYFGSPRSPRVIWAGVRMPNPALTALQKASETAISPLGYPPEDRAYSPHLTLGRVKDFRAGQTVAAAVDQLKRKLVTP